MSTMPDSEQVMFEILTAGSSDWKTAIGTRVRKKLPSGKDNKFKNKETYATIVPSLVPVGESDASTDTWTITLYGGTDNSKDSMILYRKLVARLEGASGESVTSGKLIIVKFLSVDRTPDPVKGWPRVVVIVETLMGLV